MNTMLIFLGILLTGFTFSTLLFMFFASKATPNPEENEVYTKLNLRSEKSGEKNVIRAIKEKYA